MAGAAAAAVVVGACTRQPRPVAPVPRGIPDRELSYLISRHLIVPVEGVRAATIADSFDDPRAGGRMHRAVDIGAPRGTRIRSADDGTVYRLRTNAAGGLVVYALDPSRRYVYYYAHLDRYADRLREGMAIAKGEVLGYVGTSGNAPKHEPHLHFQIMRLDDARRWWDGTPIDPLPLLTDRDHP